MLKSDQGISLSLDQRTKCMDQNVRGKVETTVHEALKLREGEREGVPCVVLPWRGFPFGRKSELFETESSAEQAPIRPRGERDKFLTVASQGDDFVHRETNALLVRREQAGATPDQISGLLLRLSEGDKSALDSLTPLVYDDLRRIAYYLLRNERPNHTLQPTALVSEMYIKFARQLKLQWQNRAHFIALAARAMRQILIDHAKYKNRIKHGAEIIMLPLDEALGFAFSQQVDLLVLDDLLRRLAIISSRKEQVVELRFFGGLNNEEIAEVLTSLSNYGDARLGIR